MGEFDSLCVVRPLLGQMCRVLEPSMTHCVRVRSGHEPKAPRAGIPGHSVCVWSVCELLHILCTSNQMVSPAPAQWELKLCLMVHPHQGKMGQSQKHV